MASGQIVCTFYCNQGGTWTSIDNPGGYNFHTNQQVDVSCVAGGGPPSSRASFSYNEDSNKILKATCTDAGALDLGPIIPSDSDTVTSWRIIWQQMWENRTITPSCPGGLGCNISNRDCGLQGTWSTPYSFVLGPPGNEFDLTAGINVGSYILSPPEPRVCALYAYNCCISSTTHTTYPTLNTAGFWKTFSNYVLQFNIPELNSTNQIQDIGVPGDITLPCLAQYEECLALEQAFGVFRFEVNWESASPSPAPPPLPTKRRFFVSLADGNV